MFLNAAESNEILKVQKFYLFYLFQTFWRFQTEDGKNMNHNQLCPIESEKDIGL